MIEDGPQGYIPGYHCDGKATTRAKEFEQMKKLLEQRFFLPTRGYLHFKELVYAKDGERTLPGKNQATALLVKYMLGLEVDPTGAVPAQHIGRYRCPKMMHLKLNLYLLEHNLPILMNPRPGQQYPLRYITYAAAMIDPGNNTLWHDGRVIIPNARDCYPDDMWNLKQTNIAELKQFGLNTKDDRQHNAYQFIRHESLNRDKMVGLIHRNPEKAVVYAAAAEKCQDAIDKRLTQLISDAFAHYKAVIKGKIQKAIHADIFWIKMLIAASIDPYVTDYTIDDIKKYAGDEICQKYLKFRKTYKNTLNTMIAYEFDMSKAADKKQSAVTKLPDDDRINMPSISKFPNPAPDINLSLDVSKRTKRATGLKEAKKQADEHIKAQPKVELPLVAIKMARRTAVAGNLI